MSREITEVSKQPICHLTESRSNAAFFMNNARIYAPVPRIPGNTASSSSISAILL